MRRVEAALRCAVADLRDLDRSFALLGGFAVSARAEPRTTKDVDLVVLVAGDADAEQLGFQLSHRRYVVDTTIEQVASGRLATIRTLSPSGAIVDRLFASSGIEPEIVRDAVPLDILDGLSVPVATVAHLIATKVLAWDDRRRPQDRLDLIALLSIATKGELGDARAALELVQERGYGRGRRLTEDLARAVRTLGPEPPNGYSGER
jgi:hypothetical protein